MNSPLKWTYHILRCCLGGIFLWSGAWKLMDPASFAVIMDAYGLVPEGTVMLLAVGIALLEVVAGLGILRDLRGSLSLIAGLLFFFMLVLGYGLHLGLDVDCGCFSAHDPEAEAFHGLRQALYRDLGMMAAVSYLFAWRWWRGHRPLSVGGFLKLIWRRK